MQFKVGDLVRTLPKIQEYGVPSKYVGVLAKIKLISGRVFVLDFGFRCWATPECGFELDTSINEVI